MTHRSFVLDAVGRSSLIQHLQTFNYLPSRPPSKLLNMKQSDTCNGLSYEYVLVAL